MTDYLLQYAASNLLFSAALALLAYGVHRRGRYPALAHLLWVLVLVKVITPPLLVLPVGLGSPAAEAVDTSMTGAVGALGSTATAVIGSGSSASAWLIDHGGALLLVVWLVGSALVLVASSQRIRGFSHLLGHTSSVAPAEIQHAANGIAYELGLRAAPTVDLSRALISPMTWWTGGRLRIILPAALLDEVDDHQLRWVLAHELAHIKRHDHLVRWVEWLACVSFWWNPVVWLARRNLRLDEEDACDALVLGQLEGQPRSYARTLLAVVEILAQPAARTPSVATGIDAADLLERRFTKIVSPARRKPVPRLLLAGVMAAAAAIMALGIGGATGRQVAPDGPSQASVEVEAGGQGVLEPGAVVATQSEQDRYALLSADVHGRRAPGGTFRGTPEADTYSGSDRDEIIVGRAGADVLAGGAGRDIIRGGKGADRLRGGRGADTIAGDAGPDSISGGSGNDAITGGAERDVIHGGDGHDTIDAGAGDDIVRTWQDGVADHVDCGRGSGDRAVVDSTDTALRCEVVVVRDPS